MTDAIPAVIGAVTSRDLKMGVGDRATLQWRDVNGTFDASDVLITGVFNVSVPSADQGQIYIPLAKLQSMLGLPDEATILTYRDSEKERPDIPGWINKDSQYSILYYFFLPCWLYLILRSSLSSVVRRK